MGWGLGYDEDWKRDIGYLVPAYCDHPGCMKKIDRGLSHVCGGEPYGGSHGCGLYFCNEHLSLHEMMDQPDGEDQNQVHDSETAEVCERCASTEYQPPFDPTPEHPEWIDWKLSHPSWAKWREENPAIVETLIASRGRRNTCWGCVHLRHARIMNANVASCARTEFVIPHQFKPDECTYWRVPMACPLPDDQVFKSENKAPAQDWVTIEWEDDEVAA